MQGNFLVMKRILNLGEKVIGKLAYKGINTDLFLSLSLVRKR